MTVVEEFSVNEWEVERGTGMGILRGGGDREPHMWMGDDRNASKSWICSSSEQLAHG